LKGFEVETTSIFTSFDLLQIKLPARICARYLTGVIKLKFIPFLYLLLRISERGIFLLPLEIDLIGK